ncbi:MAG TPA: GNAT family N-acetyltransferase [Chloroflexia bacterium]|nr:GNAT family N-acetyltransferase [Chloroflexia bacterium]
MPGEWRRGEYIISTDQARLDIDLIYRFLNESSYWAQGRSRETVERSIANSLSFGVYKGDFEEQVGFARVVTDYATFGWVADVFILEPYRGQKLGEWLIETIVAQPELQGMRRLFLATRDAHGLYSKYGFSPLENPDRFMMKKQV